ERATLEGHSGAGPPAATAGRTAGPTRWRSATARCSWTSPIRDAAAADRHAAGRRGARGGQVRGAARGVRLGPLAGHADRLPADEPVLRRVAARAARHPRPVGGGRGPGPPDAATAARPGR